MHFKIIHTNDQHSRLENYSRLVTGIKKYRDENTILLDAGDFCDFMRLEMTGTEGMAAAELLAAGGYDGAAVGNNETFDDVSSFEKLVSKASVPYISCNISCSDGSDIKGLHKSIILKRAGVRFLIIGVSPDLQEFYELFGFKYTYFADAVRGELDKNKGDYDICILLSHLGLKEDRGLTQMIEGIDIVIGGHSHVFLEEIIWENGVPISQMGCYAERLGIMEFDIQKKDDGYEIVTDNFTGRYELASSFEEDKNIIEIIQSSRKKAYENLSKTLFQVNKIIWNDYLEESPLGNIMADGLRELMKADIGIINSGVFNGGVIKGNVSEMKLLQVCPSPLNPTIFEIQGKHIRKSLEETLDAETCLKDGMGSGFRGKVVGRLNVSGIKIYYTGEAIEKITLGNSELEDEKWYTVASSDYIQRGSGYSSLGNNINEKYHRDFLRDLLRECLKSSAKIDESFKERWIKL